MLELSHSRFEKDFVRSDEAPGALLNNNVQALQAYKRTKRKMAAINRAGSLDDKVQQLSEQVQRLTALVEGLIADK